MQDGWTALMWAAGNDHADCARLLLDAGADTNVKGGVRAPSGGGVGWGMRMVLKVGCSVGKCTICLSVLIFQNRSFYDTDSCVDSSRRRGKCGNTCHFSILLFGVVSCIVGSD